MAGKTDKPYYMNIRICHISTVHQTTDIRVFHKECRSLAKAGYDVTYLNQGTHDEVIDGVRCIGLGRPVIKNKFKRITYGCRLLIKKAIEMDADIYHIHDSELLRYAKKLKKHNKTVIYDSHEHLPMQIMEKEWLPKPARPVVAYIVGKIEMRAVRYTDLILVVAGKTFERFNRTGIKVLQIENYPIFSEFKDIKIDYSLKKEHKRLCYTGAIWLERGLDTMCEAASLLEKGNLEIAGRIDIKNPEEYIQSFGPKLKFSGYLTRDEVIGLYEKCLCGVCLFKPFPNNMIDPPTKIFEYMAAGIPVIGSDFDSISSVLKKYDCGICVNPLDIKAIRDAMEYIIENPDMAEEMGRRGRKAVEMKFNWEIHSGLLLDAYRELSEDYNG